MDGLKLLIVSDAQDVPNEDAVHWLTRQEKPDAILDCGDHYSYNHSPVPRYFVHGNNEPWEMLDKIRNGSPDAPRNWIWLKPGEIYTITKGAVSVPLLGLGGNYGHDSWVQKMTRGQADNHHGRAHFVHEEYARFFSRDYSGFKGRGILMLHEPPQKLDIAGHMGSTALNTLVDHLLPAFVFSGHLHKYIDLTEKSTRMVCFDKPESTYGVLEVSSEPCLRVVQRRNL